MDNFSLLWHDYETWGANPRLDRPLQFAAIRTDHDLNIIDEPIELYATPPVDIWPNPESCLVVGLSPQEVLKKPHLSEVDFINQVNQHMLEPGTCSVGYNNLRFDDEVTRFSLYRNLYDPYAREWKNGNSRWDLIDPLRLARALRPQGINWPTDEQGKPSMRLVNLTAANKIQHTDAHNALADVYATIAMAKLLKTSQPKLYDFVFNNRNKAYISKELSLLNPKMLIHISGMYPGERGNMAIVYPIAQHPTNNNGVVVFDLACSPDELKSDDIEFLHKLVFTKTEDLPDNLERLPIKTININKCPVIAPIKALNAEAISRFNLDLELCEENLITLKKIDNLENKVQQILSFSQFDQQDPELSLYDGFIKDKDRELLDKIHKAYGNINLADYNFIDPRLPELAFRFKARNYPHNLTAEETNKWHRFIKHNLNTDTGLGMSITEYRQEIKRLRQEHPEPIAEKILDELEQWAQIINIY